MIELDLDLLDLSNHENVKQCIINNFHNYDLFIKKIRKSRLGGYFVYHSRGVVHKRKVRTLIKDMGYRRFYSVEIKKYGVSFIDDYDKDVFADYLTMAILEALRRKPI